MDVLFYFCTFMRLSFFTFFLSYFFTFSCVNGLTFSHFPTKMYIHLYFFTFLREKVSRRFARFGTFA